VDDPGEAQFGHFHGTDVDMDARHRQKLPILPFARDFTPRLDPNPMALDMAHSEHQIDGFLLLAHNAREGKDDTVTIIGMHQMHQGFAVNRADIGQPQARQVAERLTYAAQQLRALAQEMDLEP
jgi:hypothetical protein